MGPATSIDRLHSYLPDLTGLLPTLRLNPLSQHLSLTLPISSESQPDRKRLCGHEIETMADRLPTETRDAVRTCSKPRSENRSVADTCFQILLFVADDYRLKHPYLDKPHWSYRGFTPQGRRNLANLRLVSKTFCWSASPIFFQHYQATIDGNEGDPKAWRRLVHLAKGPYARHVRHLEVGLKPREGSDATRPLIRHVRSFDKIFADCLAQFPNLNALQIHGQMSNCSRGIAGLFRHIVVTALRNVPLPNLTELDITLPIAHDFETFFAAERTPSPISIRDVFGRLRHLGLFLSDYTNHIGRYSPRRVSAANAAHPNNVHVIQLVNLVELAVNLESLAIGGSDPITINDLRLPRGLASLSLQHVSISFDVLDSLILDCKKTLTSIELRQVEAERGNWSDALKVLHTKLTNLHNFIILSSGYSERGENFLLRPDFPCDLSRDPYEFPDIETLFQGDLTELGMLQRQVSENRFYAGLEDIPLTEFRRMPGLIAELEWLEAKLLSELHDQGE